MKLSSIRVLLTNDDGISARGLDVLLTAIKPLVAEVWVVAPEEEQSGSGHSLTLRRPLRIRKVADKQFAVDGTPTDCVLLAVSEIMKSSPPDIIFSGINRGGNLGGDITYSGTIAAAMEGVLLGIRSIAFSLVYNDPKRLEWETAANWIEPVLSFLSTISFPEGVLMNVNFPPIKSKSIVGISAVRQGQRKIGDELKPGIDPRGDRYFWIGSQRSDSRVIEGTDLAAIRHGMISVTPLSLDLTHVPTLRKIQSASKKLGSADE